MTHTEARHILAQLEQATRRCNQIAASWERAPIKRERAAVNLCTVLQEMAATTTPEIQAAVDDLVALYMHL